MVTGYAADPEGDSMSDATPGDAQERSAEQNKSEAELIGRIIQSEQKLSDYFTTMIVKSVTDQLERRNVARYGSSAWWSPRYWPSPSPA